MVSSMQINSRENVRSAKLFNQIIQVRNRESVAPGDCVKCAKVNAEAKTAIRFSSKQNRRGERRERRADVPVLQEAVEHVAHEGFGDR